MSEVKVRIKKFVFWGKGPCYIPQYYIEPKYYKGDLVERGGWAAIYDSDLGLSYDRNSFDEVKKVIEKKQYEMGTSKNSKVLYLDKDGTLLKSKYELDKEKGMDVIESCKLEMLEQFKNASDEDKLKMMVFTMNQITFNKESIEELQDSLDTHKIVEYELQGFYSDLAKL
ncbi:HAD-like domain protein [Vibrio phage 1.170.O._10N.261.52.C3]|nr:HAD-like domain protein [Vibrio phage 1.170.O._10N.261.52.C3]